jgi:hypothetical protein
MVLKLFQDHSFAALYPDVKPIFRAPQGYHSSAQLQQFNCTDRKIRTSKTDNFDAQGNLVFVNLAAINEKPSDVKEGTPQSFLFNIVCGAATNSLAGTYEGTIATTYKRGWQSEQRFQLLSGKPETI